MSGPLAIMSCRRISVTLADLQRRGLKQIGFVNNDNFRTVP